MHTFHMRSSYATLMPVSSQDTHAIWIGRLMAIVDLTWESPFLGIDFWEGTLNLAVILEIPKMAGV